MARLAVFDSRWIIPQSSADSLPSFVAHRLSIIRNANRILVMERGRVVVDGSHLELIGQDVHYARLHGHQMVGAGEMGATDYTYCRHLQTNADSMYTSVMKQT